MESGLLYDSPFFFKIGDGENFKFLKSSPSQILPVQVKVMPITDNQLDYAKEVTNKLRANRIRVELDDRNEKIGYKIREAQLQKVPYMLVVGEKEVNAGTVGVRSRKDGDVGAIAVDEFIKNIKEEIENFVR